MYVCICVHILYICSVVTCADALIPRRVLVELVPLVASVSFRRASGCTQGPASVQRQGAETGTDTARRPAHRIELGETAGRVAVAKILAPGAVETTTRNDKATPRWHSL